MVLVGVGEHEAEQIAALLDEITNVGQDEIDAGQRIVAECNIEIDCVLLLVSFIAEPVDREIHPDLADPAERREYEFVGRTQHDWIRSTGHFGGSGRAQEHVPRRDRGDSAIWQAQPEPARLVERLEPARDLAAGKTHAHILAETGRAREPFRADGEKPSPAFHCARRASIFADSAPNTSSDESEASARSVAG
jgi:hypothetical protein